MAMSPRSSFVLFGAVPVTVLSIAAGAAFTFGQDVSQVNGSQEQVDYVVMASNTTSSANEWTETSYIGDNPALTSGQKLKTIATKYGELPQWFQVDSGAGGVPSAVQEAGDLAFINAQSSTTTGDDTNNGRGAAGSAGSLTDVVQALRITGSITNVAALRQTYGSCLIPIRLWSTVDDGLTFTDVTRVYLDTQLTDTTGTNGQNSPAQNPPDSSTNPFYVDCSTGEFSFTVPTAAAADNGGTATGTTPYHSTANLAYEVSVERGGTFGTFDNNTGAQPEFVVQATPVAYDPTNQFNAPGASGNAQYRSSITTPVDAFSGDVDLSITTPTPMSVYLSDVAIVGRYAYVAGGTSGPGMVAIVRLRDGSVVKHLESGANSTSIATAYGKVFVAAAYGQDVTVIDPTTRVVTARITGAGTTPTGGTLVPHSAGFANPIQVAVGTVAAHQYLFIANIYAGVTVVDADTAMAVSDIPVPGENWGIVVSGDYAYVPNRYGGTVTVIDLAKAVSDPTNATVSTIPLPTGSKPVSGVAVDGFLYMTDWHNNRVDVIDLSKAVSDPTNAWEKSIAVGSNPYYAAAFGGSIYVSNTGGTDISVIDPVTRTLSSTLTTSGLSPRGVAGSAGTLYVAGSSTYLRGIPLSP